MTKILGITLWLFSMQMETMAHLSMIFDDLWWCNIFFLTYDDFLMTYDDVPYFF